MSNDKEIKSAMSPACTPADNNNDRRQRRGGRNWHNCQCFHNAAAANLDKFKGKIKEIQLDNLNITGLINAANFIGSFKNIANYLQL